MDLNSFVCFINSYIYSIVYNYFSTECLKSENVDEVFSLCTKGELNKYRVPWLLNEMTGADIIVHHYPFPDGQTPNMPSLLKMVDEILVSVRNGRKPLVQ